VVTVLAVRHADIELPRVSADPPLSPAGRDRAAALERLAAGSGVGAIFISEFLRTRETVEPLAQFLGIPPLLTPEPTEWARRARAGELGEVLLVAGHSNTVPAILASLGAVPVPVIREDEFDNLFVLTTMPQDSAALLRLGYGASP